MRAFLLSILVLAFVAGCQSPPQPQDPPEGYDFGPYPSEIESKVRAYFEAVLKDPESARYRHEDGFIKVVCNKWLGERAITYAGWGKVVGVNAKNSYGGYTGETRYAFLFEGERIYDVFDNSEFSAKGCRKLD